MMAGAKKTDDPRAATSLTLERFGEIVDAYGAAAERWPHAEREAARHLVVESAEARALLKRAAELDARLDSLGSEPPSALLAARVLAAAPRKRAVRNWRRAVAAIIPLAAAAALALWLVGRTPEEVSAPSIASLSIPLGEYTDPTDVLLDSYAIDVSGASMPSLGCSGSALGCPTVDALEDSLSQRSPGESAPSAGTRSMGSVHQGRTGSTRRMHA
jgi:hypothetical protein